MIAEGNMVAWRWAVQGMQSGNFQGPPATGKDFVLAGMSFLRLEDGKFAENWVEQDLAGRIQQLRE